MEQAYCHSCGSRSPENTQRTDGFGAFAGMTFSPCLYKNVPFNIQSPIEAISEQVIVPLLPRRRQDELLIPFSDKQTVIASSLKQLDTLKEEICNRPVVVHIAREEVGRIAETLLSIRDSVSQITLRLRNITQFDDADIEAYTMQLKAVGDALSLTHILKLKGHIKIHNLISNNGENGRYHEYRCPAGNQSLTVGPDGQIYACPAFFFSDAGSHSIDTLRTSQNKFSIGSFVSGCVCNSNKCPGCEFLKLSNIQGKMQICKVYEAEAGVGSTLMRI